MVGGPSSCGLQLRRPSCHTYSSALRQCIREKDLSKGKEVHQLMVSNDYDRGSYLGNLLLHMYVSCGGSVEDAERVFGRIHSPDTFSWNMLMAGYAHSGKVHDARTVFQGMLSPRNVVSWTILTAALAQSGHLNESWGLFQKMAGWNVISQTAMIKVAAQVRDLRGARSMFESMCERTHVSWNSMLVAYAQSGHLDAARRVLERAPGWDVVACTTMVVAYAENCDLANARAMFECMRSRTVAPWNAMIKAYAESGEVGQARFVFDKAPMRDVITCTSMVDGYAQVGDLESARAVFEEMPERNAVTWGVIISAYAKQAGEESVRLFLRMDSEGIQAEEMTYVAVLDACASAAAIVQGRIVHESVVERGLETDLRIGSALVNMYAKFGQLEMARKIFLDIPVQDVILWTSLIVSYAYNGFKREAVEVLEQMQLEGFNPDSVSFVSVLTACSHSGIKADSWFHILRMTRDDYGIELSFAHYLCVLDLLGRAGQVEQLEELINSMPYQPEVVTWTVLLSSCKENGDHVRAARAAQQIQLLDPSQRAPYTLLPNMLAAATSPCSFQIHRRFSSV